VVGDIRRAVNEEWERLRRGEKTRADLTRSLKRVRDAADQADRLVGESAPDAPGVGPAGPGDFVDIAHLGLKGEILSVDGGTATVRAGAVTLKVPVQAVRRAVAQGASHPAGQRPAVKGRVEVPDKSSVAGELRLIGKTTDEARDLLEEYLDDAFMAGLPSVRIIHGKGTGAVRRAVEDVLSTHPLVTAHRPGSASEGGGGATVAALGQS
jgi:DNA mismatch repair protein MutS2